VPLTNGAIPAVVYGSECILILLQETAANINQTLVKHRSNTGQTPVKHQSNINQTLGKHLSNTGQTPVKHSLNIGQTLRCEVSSGSGKLQQPSAAAVGWSRSPAAVPLTHLQGSFQEHAIIHQLPELFKVNVTCMSSGSHHHLHQPHQQPPPHRATHRRTSNVMKPAQMTDRHIVTLAAAGLLVPVVTCDWWPCQTY
jgi:hypothetical protein